MRHPNKTNGKKSWRPPPETCVFQTSSFRHANLDTHSCCCYALPCPIPPQDFWTTDAIGASIRNRRRCKRQQEPREPSRRPEAAAQEPRGLSPPPLFAARTTRKRFCDGRGAIDLITTAYLRVKGGSRAANKMRAARSKELLRRTVPVSDDEDWSREERTRVSRSQKNNDNTRSTMTGQVAQTHSLL